MSIHATSDATHVRVHYAISIAPIFQPLKRDSRQTRSLDISYKHHKNVYRFTSNELLGVGDQSVLLALIHIGQNPKYKNPPRQPRGCEEKKLRTLLMESPPYDGKCRKVETTLSEIARVTGHKSGGNSLSTIKASLHRLSNVTLYLQQNGIVNQTRLVSCLIDEQAGIVQVCLSFPLSCALRGELPYNSISLSERAALKREGSKILHAWVSSVMGKRATFQISLDKLEKHVWFDAAKSFVVQRKRRERIRNFLKDFENLPEWQVSITTKGIVAFVRPNGHKSTSVQSQPSSKQSRAISVKHCIPRIHSSKTQRDNLI